MQQARKKWAAAEGGREKSDLRLRAYADAATGKEGAFGGRSHSVMTCVRAFFPIHTRTVYIREEKKGGRRPFPLGGRHSTCMRETPSIRRHPPLPSPLLGPLLLILRWMEWEWERRLINAKGEPRKKGSGNGRRAERETPSASASAPVCGEREKAKKRALFLPLQFFPDHCHFSGLPSPSFRSLSRKSVRRGDAHKKRDSGRRQILPKTL